LLDAMKMMNIRRKIRKCYVGHGFIKAHMVSNLDSLSSFIIIPKNVLGGARKIFKEDAALSMDFEFSWTFTRWANPNSTTKGSKMGTIFFSAKSSI
jgi:hypothetical protein